MKTAMEWQAADESGLRKALYQAHEVCVKALLAGPISVGVGRPQRSLDQNAKLWAILADVSAQVDWYGQRLSETDWKNVFSASLFQQRTVPGIDGGFVVLGQSTSRMNKAEFSQLIELIHAFGADHNVTWSEKAQGAYDQYREAQQGSNES